MDRILNLVRNQLIEVIEWTDDSRDTLSFRWPDEDKEIKNGAQLIVRESQQVQFVAAGQFADAKSAEKLAKKGASLLGGTNNTAPINEISAMVGYENPLRFSRAFKEIYNISPREFRRKHYKPFSGR